MDNPVGALRLVPTVRSSLDQAELTLIESIMDRGWTWEQLGAVYGERSKQAMQQHYRRRGGHRNWPTAQRQRSTATPPEGNTGAELDPADVETVRAAVAGLMSTFSATGEALTHMTGAPWNRRDPSREAQRHLSWTERLSDSLQNLNEWINNQLTHDLPRVDRPLIIGQRNRIHADHVEIDGANVDHLHTAIDDTLTRLHQHRDTINQTIDELQRRRTELAVTKPGAPG